MTEQEGIVDLKTQLEQLKVEHYAIKARLETIEHDLIQRRDLIEKDIDFIESLLRLTRV